LLILSVYLPHAAKTKQKALAGAGTKRGKEKENNARERRKSPYSPHF
jgi:hypothetical protein